MNPKRFPQHDARVTGTGHGYVYVMSYPGSDKVKIGHAVNPSTRAKDIGGTLAPETPIIEVLFWCSERREDVERRAHKLLMGHRCNGEWFATDIGSALTAVGEAAQLANVQAAMVFERAAYAAEQAKIEAERAAERAAKDAAAAAAWKVKREAYERQQADDERQQAAHRAAIKREREANQWVLKRIAFGAFTALIVGVGMTSLMPDTKTAAAPEPAWKSAPLAPEPAPKAIPPWEKYAAQQRRARGASL